MQAAYRRAGAIPEAHIWGATHPIALPRNSRESDRMSELFMYI